MTLRRGIILENNQIEIKSFDNSWIGKVIRKGSWPKGFYITATAVGKHTLLGIKSGNEKEDAFWISFGDLNYWEMYGKTD